MKVIMLALTLHPKSIALEMTLDPGADIPMMMIQMVWYMHLLTFKISMLQFLQSGNTMIISWRSTRSFVFLVNAYLMDLWSTLQVAKLKPKMFLIWCGPDGEDIYDNFQLNDNEMYDIDYVMEQFKLYCEPICNFQAARYLFRQVSQCENETTNAFYHHTQKLCVQCQFSDEEECLVGTIIMVPKYKRQGKSCYRCRNTSPYVIVLSWG